MRHLARLLARVIEPRPTGNLVRRPFLLHRLGNVLLQGSMVQLLRAAAMFSTLLGKALRLLLSIAAPACVAANLAANRAAMPTQRAGDLGIRFALLPHSVYNSSLLKGKMFSHRWASVRTPYPVKDTTFKRPSDVFSNNSSQRLSAAVAFRV